MADWMGLHGRTFGRLTVVALGASRGGRTYWLCRCSCADATEKEIGATKLTSGNTRSCGCLRREMNREKARERNERGIKHGLARNGRPHPLYWTWCAMRKRCRDPRADPYGAYVGSGVKVCARWEESFVAFIEDVGERPEGTTLDRINPFGDYEPGNVRWATRKEQGENTRAHWEEGWRPEGWKGGDA